MSNYYNEFDHNAAAWLRDLIAMGAIPKGEVDERSIIDVRPEDLRGFVQCHFFAGIGGWSEALRRAGIPATRPLWTGSCPCQDYSCAGKGKGMSGHRDLWPAFFRLIRECRPERVLGEQVEAAVGHGWLDRLSADMEAEGYAVGSVVLGAHSAGGDHIRQRLYWVADSEFSGRKQQPLHESFGVQHEAFAQTERLFAVGGRGTGERAGLGNPDCQGYEGHGRYDGQHDTQGWEGQERYAGPSNFWSNAVAIPCRDNCFRRAEPGVFPLVAKFRRNLGRGGDSCIPSPDDLVTLETANQTGEARVMRLKGYGNAICVETAKLFIEACEGVLK